MLLPWSLSNAKWYCTEVKLLFLGKYTTRCIFLQCPSFTDLEEFFQLGTVVYELRQIWAKVRLKMVFEALQHTFKLKKNFVCSKFVNPQETFWLLGDFDFMIAVEAFIKSLDYQKKLNWCFVSTFIEVADSEPAQTSKIELFPEIFNCFKPLSIFAETFIVDVWVGFEYTCFMTTKYRKTWLG